MRSRSSTWLLSWADTVERRVLLDHSAFSTAHGEISVLCHFAYMRAFPRSGVHTWISSYSIFDPACRQNPSSITRCIRRRLHSLILAGRAYRTRMMETSRPMLDIIIVGSQENLHSFAEAGCARCICGQHMWPPDLFELLSITIMREPLRGLVR